MYAILDTCVLVSALRSKDGASHLILRAALAGKIRLALSVSLAIEYEDVALRPGLIPALKPEQIVKVIDALCRLSQHQRIFYTWRPFLPDPGDDLVLELALAAGAPFIITQNLKDFRGADSLGIRTITPAQALTII
ncbi:MAG: putative toxin-antitoxin system toxin component, PIN family [Luteolibacter sp.]